jgi:hypothetical protein
MFEWMEVVLDAESINQSKKLAEMRTASTCEKYLRKLVYNLELDNLTLKEQLKLASQTDHM